MAKLREYARLMRLDRPIGAWLLLWPALWALWIAGDGRPAESLLVIFVAGTVLARSAGCVINDFADRGYDPHVRRTADRPLARGSVSTTEALALFAVLGAASLALVIPLNRPARLLALAGGVVTVIYPFLKRFFRCPRRGSASHSRGRCRWRLPRRPARCLGWRGCCSQPPSAGSSPTTRSTRWSTATTTCASACTHPRSCSGAATAWRSACCSWRRSACSSSPATASGCGAGSVPGLVVAALLAVQQLRLIWAREPASCFRAFLANNWFGCAVFVGIALDYLFR
jgi:4-hydroxybenzoate polyprenyltransferase